MMKRFLCKLGIHSWALDGEKLFGVKYPLLVQVFKCEDCGAEKAERSAVTEERNVVMGQMDVARAKSMIHYKEINFVQATQNDKHGFWICEDAKSDSEIGTVEWYGALRQYRFFSSGTAWLGNSQLENIAMFIDEKNREHAEKEAPYLADGRLAVMDRESRRIAAEVDREIISGKKEK